MVGVLPSFFATDSMACTMFFFACAAESTCSKACRASAASRVPDQVRKSLAV
jgi:hypothetical protein